VNEIIDRLAFDVMGEVSMAFIRLRTFKATADVVSGILNWVCPECGGRMGGRGKEFKCQGECQMDWRQVWERVRTVGH
jgi:tRNA(Ile2) C34 agmatinyltransferase TiaS